MLFSARFNTVLVSGIVGRVDELVNARTANVNKILKELSWKNKFPFIDNSNIDTRSVWGCADTSEINNPANHLLENLGGRQLQR